MLLSNFVGGGFIDTGELFDKVNPVDGSLVANLDEVTDAYRLWSRTELGSTSKALVALLGATRAAALEAIEYGCTTSGLADLLGVSPPTASYHVTVLRDAGLITTYRRGTTVLHTVSPLGTALLNGGQGQQRG